MNKSPSSSNNSSKNWAAWTSVSNSIVKAGDGLTERTQELNQDQIQSIQMSENKSRVIAAKSVRTRARDSGLGESLPYNNNGSTAADESNRQIYNLFDESSPSLSCVGLLGYKGQQFAESEPLHVSPFDQTLTSGSTLKDLEMKCFQLSVQNNAALSPINRPAPLYATNAFESSPSQDRGEDDTMQFDFEFDSVDEDDLSTLKNEPVATASAGRCVSPALSDGTEEPEMFGWRVSPGIDGPYRIEYREQARKMQYLGNVFPQEGDIPILISNTPARERTPAAFFNNIRKAVQECDLRRARNEQMGVRDSKDNSYRPSSEESRRLAQSLPAGGLHRLPTVRLCPPTKKL